MQQRSHAIRLPAAANAAATPDRSRSQIAAHRCDVRRGWLAVGDAAIAFDPLTSQGIAKALDHGKRAAASIAAYLAGDV